MHCAVPLSGLDLLCANWSDCGLLPPKIDLARNLRRAESPLWDVLWCSRWRTHATRWAMAAIGWAISSLDTLYPVGYSLYNCCVSIQGLRSSEAAFEGQLRHSAAQRLSQFKGSSKCSLVFPVFAGLTATILRGLTYPKIICAPKGERQRKHGDSQINHTDNTLKITIIIINIKTNKQPSHNTEIYKRH